MSIPTEEQVREALTRVIDPEIRRPITDLGMVESVEISDDGVVTVGVLLTVSGCPLRDTITADTRKEVGAIDGVTDVQVRMGVMNDEQRAELRTRLRGGAAEPVIPFTKPGSLTKVYAVTSGKGGVGKSSVTANLAAALAAATAEVSRYLGGRTTPRSPASPSALTAQTAAVDLSAPLGTLDKALEEVRELYLDHAVGYHHPRYLAHLNCPITIPAVITDELELPSPVGMAIQSRISGPTVTRANRP